jgi:hypothetical protein
MNQSRSFLRRIQERLHQIIDEAPASALLACLAVLCFPLGLVYQQLYYVSAAGVAAVFLISVRRQSSSSIYFSMWIVGWTCMAMYVAEPSVETSWYQAVRSGVPFVGLLLAFGLRWKSQAEAKSLDLPLAVFTYIGVLQVISILLDLGGLSIGNFAIVTDSEQGEIKRYYTYPTALQGVLVWVGIRHGRLLLSITGAICLLAAQSKVFTIILVWAVVSGWYQRRVDQEHRPKLILPVAIGVVIFVGGVAAVPGLYDRYAIFAGNGGDFMRLFEIQSGLAAWTYDIQSVFFGRGFGVSISEGYYNLFSAYSEDRAGSFENCKYDIHNGFIAVAAKAGLIGVIWLAWTLWAWSARAGMRKIIIPIFILQFASAGGLATSFDGALLILAAGWYTSYIDGRPLGRGRFYLNISNGRSGVI